MKPRPTPLPDGRIAFRLDRGEYSPMLGGLLLIFLALLGYMAFSPWVIPPFALICAAAWVFRPRRGQVAPGWSWRSYFAGLPVFALITVLAYVLGWGMRIWTG